MSEFHVKIHKNLSKVIAFIAFFAVFADNSLHIALVL